MGAWVRGRRAGGEERNGGGRRGEGMRTQKPSSSWYHPLRPPLVPVSPPSDGGRPLSPSESVGRFGASSVE